MPVYEYRCENGHSFDVIQSMSEDPVKDCEVCGVLVQRVLHSPAVHFKGSGFYNTDYGTKKRGPSSGESSKESSSGNSGSESKSSDSKSSESKSSVSKSSDSSSGGKEKAAAKAGD